MNTKLKSFITFPFLIICCSMLLLCCHKTVPESVIENSTFLRVYPDSGNQFCYSVIPTDDNGSLLIASDYLNELNDASALSILKMDAAGKLIWKNKLPNINMQYPVSKTFNDGSTIISSYYSGSFCKIDKTGKVIFVNSFTPINNVSPAIQSLNGDYHIITSTGGQSANYSIIKSFKEDGTYKGEFSIPHFNFVSDIKILTLNIFKCDTFGTFYFAGACWPHWNNIFRNQRAKLFVAKQTYVGNTLIQNKILVIDSLDKNWNLNDMQYTVTRDNKLLLITTQFDYNTIYRGTISKLDLDLNIIWEKEVRFGDGTSVYSLNECADGSILFTGECGVGGKTSWQPFAAKMDQNGNILWKQIYKTPLSGTMGMGIEMSDGSLLLGGKTSGLGEGITGDDLTLMKTDKDGNLK